jgi:hypothetical protein
MKMQKSDKMMADIEDSQLDDKLGGLLPSESRASMISRNESLLISSCNENPDLS